MRFDEEGRPCDQRPSKSLNLCTEGVSLESSFPVDPGEMLRITMALGDTLVTFKGKVIHVNRSDDQSYRFGISVRDIGKADRIALTRYIYYFKS
jgi:hypothetical protein